MIVLGIDPGYAIVGYGVIEYHNNHFKVLDFGAITTEAHTPFNERIEKIFDEANELIQRFRPDAMAIEKLFFNTNQTTAIAVAEARGVILLAAKQLQIAEHLLHTFAEAANLNEAGLNGIEQTDTDQQENQNVVG